MNINTYLCGFCNKEFNYYYDRKVDAGYEFMCPKHRYKNYTCHDEEWKNNKEIYFPKTARCCDGTDCIQKFHKKEMAKLSRLLNKNVCIAINHPYSASCKDWCKQ